jgi:hypothetical protein
MMVVVMVELNACHKTITTTIILTSLSGDVCWKTFKIFQWCERKRTPGRAQGQSGK